LLTNEKKRMPNRVQQHSDDRPRLPEQISLAIAAAIGQSHFTLAPSILFPPSLLD
jgi:hypothetical protein